MSKENFMDQKELARRWNMQEGTLASWRYKGHGPKYIKIGTSIRYRVSDIEMYERDRYLISPGQR